MFISYEEKYELQGKLESIACLKMLQDRGIYIYEHEPLKYINLTGAGQWLHETIQFIFPNAEFGETYDKTDTFIASIISDIKVNSEYVIFIEDERLAPFLRSKATSNLFFTGTNDAEIKKLDDNSIIICFDYHFELLELFESIIQIYDLIGGKNSGNNHSTNGSN